MQRNIFPKLEFMYLVVDSSNLDAVLLSTGSATTAKAVALSDRRLRCRAIETWAKWINKDFKEFDFNTMEETYLYNWRSGSRSLTVAGPDVVTDEFKKFRKEIKDRHSWHEALDTLCSLIMLPVPETERHLEYAPHIVSQLQQCDPNNNIYTDAISAYASATNCTPATAYTELNLHVENIAHARLRNLGIYIKHRNMLNAAGPSNAEQKAVYDSARDELINNSLV